MRCKRRARKKINCRPSRWSRRSSCNSRQRCRRRNEIAFCNEGNQGHDMTIRLQQMHPALVRLPLTLLPLAVAANLAGKSATTRSSAISDRRPSVWPHSARSLSLPAGSSPGRSQRRARVARHADDAPQPELRCHGRRNADGRLALWPKAAERALSWHRPRGRRRGRVYRLSARQAAFGAAAADLRHGVQHMIEEVASGTIVPTLTAWCAQHLSMKQ